MASVVHVYACDDKRITDLQLLQGAVPNGVDPHVHATSSHNDAANEAERNYGLASAAVRSTAPSENGPKLSVSSKL